MQTIFEAIRSDHARQRKLVAALVDTVGDSDERASLFEELKLELTAHAQHEERQFYVPLIEHDVTQEKARHSVAEHKELDDYVEKLEDYDRSSPQWLQTARLLRERLEHHLDEEEHEVFQLAGRILSDDEQSELAKAYVDGMESERSNA